MTQIQMIHSGLISPNSFDDNMRTRRIRAHLAKRLNECGNHNPQTFRQLLDYVNATMRHGTTSSQLSNVLAKNPEFIECGKVKAAGMLSGGYDITVWVLREELGDVNED